MRRKRTFQLMTGPAIVEARARMEPRKQPLRQGTKREVREFSAEARRNLLKAALRFPWDEMGPVALVTLTYPEDFPLDGWVAKWQLDRLWKRWESKFGERPWGLWAMEFQRRGAIHFHAFLRVPALPGLEEDRYEVLKAWGFGAWSEIVGFESDPVEAYHHERMGLRFNVSPGWYAGSLSALGIAEYLVAHAGKGAQKELPPGLVRPGRFWGAVGERHRRSAVETWDLCCEHSLADVMRVLRHLGPRRRRRKRPSGAQRRRYAEWDEKRRERVRREIAASRRHQWRPVGGWRKVENGRRFGVLGPWAVGLCPAHGPSSSGWPGSPPEGAGHPLLGRAENGPPALAPGDPSGYRHASRLARGRR